MGDVQVLSGEIPKVAPERLLRRLGYKRGLTVLQPEIVSMIEAEVERAPDYLRPAGRWATLPIIGVSPDQVQVEAMTWSSAPLSRVLHLASRVSVLVVTAGALVEEKASDLFAHGEWTRATIVDAIGSETAEALADQANRKIALAAGRLGYLVTKRFSPGFGGWDLADQIGLLAAVRAAEMGIKPTQGYMLHPRKSVTAVVGWIGGH
jgi:hypothetical protein